MSNNKKKIGEYVKPSAPKPGRTPEEMVSAAHASLAAMGSSPEWPVASAVQQVAAAWSLETDNVDALQKEIAYLLNKLSTSRTALLDALYRWSTLRQGVLAAVDTHCMGSKAKVQSFGFNLSARNPRAQAVAPEGLRQRKRQAPGTVSLAWTPQQGVHNYLGQYATDPANPATYSAPITCDKASCLLSGLPLGATLHFRVLAIDATLPGGQTSYSSWLSVVVSS